MLRFTFAVALLGCFCAVSPASADDARPPDAARVRAAAEQFDAGVAAYKLRDYESAGSHFEAADAAVPGPKALRQAIRARSEAGQGARAATLAALALDRYPSDEATTKLAHEILEKYEPLVQKVKVTCASPCVLGVTSPPATTRSVPGEARTVWVVYLDGGAATLSASFADGSASAPKRLEAKPGAATDLRFEPKRKPPPPPADDASGPEAPSPSNNEVPPEEAKVEPPPPPPKGISPGFFAAGVVAAAGLGATTIWSGIDTENNPGVAAVIAACHGKGPSCELYQEGLAHQTRTNALIGATAGVAAVTVVLAIFTNWHGGGTKTPAVEPTALVVDRGGVLGAAGVF